MREGFDFACE